MARRELVSFVGIVVIALGVLIGLRERRLGSTLAQLFVPVASVIAVLGVSGLIWHRPHARQSRGVAPHRGDRPG